MKTKKLMLLVLAIFFSGHVLNAQVKMIKKVHCEQETLDLSDEQEAAVQKLHTAHMKEMLPLKNQMAEKKARLNTLMTVEKPDMAAINKVVDEIGALQTQMMKKKVDHKQEVRKLLNEEQRIKFDMMMCHSKDKGMGPGMESGMGMHHKMMQGQK